MSNSRRSYRSNRRLNTTVKVAALVAALGFVTVMLEQPRLTASPSRSNATIEQSLQPTDASGTAMTRAASELVAAGVSRLPESASEHLPAYFPGQFAPPGGEIEAQPATF
jgi:hypothetical protein